MEFGKVPVTFGRRPECGMSFPDADAMASGRHAEVLRRDGRWLVRDLGSLNGTWIGEMRLTGEHELGATTVIELGKGGV